MRIFIDLQSCQTQSAQRGIGRYSLQLTEALLQHHPEHEFYLVFSGLFPQKLRELKTYFSTYLPPERLLVWYGPYPTHLHGHFHEAHFQIASYLRETFLAQYHPDIILVTSLFEGFSDHAVTSIKTWYNTPTAVILYDLIPMLYPEHYLKLQAFKAYYLNHLQSLEKADLILSISKACQTEALTHLNATLPIHVIHSAVSSHFQKKTYSAETIRTCHQALHLTRPFLMYTGGIDHRKNIDGLIQAFARLPQSLRQHYQLAIVCYMHPDIEERLKTLAKQHGLNECELICTGFVDEETLIMLYNTCHAFVFPSKHEGFGLPILEAMQCGAPVIGSHLSSIPEALGYEAALFDPNDPVAFTMSIERVLTDDVFRNALKEHAIRHTPQFSWLQTAKKTIQALETITLPKSQQNVQPSHILPTLYQLAGPQDLYWALECLAMNNAPRHQPYVFVHGASQTLWDTLRRLNTDEYPMIPVRFNPHQRAYQNLATSTHPITPHPMDIILTIMPPNPIEKIYLTRLSLQGVYCFQRTTQAPDHSPTHPFLTTITSSDEGYYWCTMDDTLSISYA